MLKQLKIAEASCRRALGLSFIESLIR